MDYSPKTLKRHCFDCVTYGLLAAALVFFVGFVIWGRSGQPENRGVNGFLDTGTVGETHVRGTSMHHYSRVAGEAEGIIAVSHGRGFNIEWCGDQETGGARPVDILRASLVHIQATQLTPEATEANAKMIARLIPAIEEFEGVEPTMGGDLNDLLPTTDESQ